MKTVGELLENVSVSVERKAILEGFNGLDYVDLFDVAKSTGIPKIKVVEAARQLAEERNDLRLINGMTRLIKWNTRKLVERGLMRHELAEEQRTESTTVGMLNEKRSFYIDQLMTLNESGRPAGDLARKIRQIDGMISSVGERSVGDLGEISVSDLDK
jgi:hypothetical protein